MCSPRTIEPHPRPLSITLTLRIVEEHVCDREGCLNGKAVAISYRHPHHMNSPSPSPLERRTRGSLRAMERGQGVRNTPQPLYRTSTMPLQIAPMPTQRESGTGSLRKTSAQIVVRM